MADVTEVTACGSCGWNWLTEILTLGSQPLSERESQPYPLTLLKCPNCSLVQLSHIVDQREVFPPDHPYAAGNTLANRRRFAELAQRILPRLVSGDMVVDIGANDGTFLAAVAKAVPQVVAVGVEPTDQARKGREQGLEVWQEFFTYDVAMRMRAELGAAKVITASNVLAHVPDPHDFLAGVTALLADDGLFVTENHDWASIANGLQIDTVYHEHLRFYSVASLSYLLARHGLLVSDMERIPMHGGSFRTWAVREQPDLEGRADFARGALRRLLEKASEEGKIYGISASTRATPLIHYTGIESYLACVCEVPGSEKIGQTMPGTLIPIVDEAALITDQPPYALLFAWHVADSIVPKLRAAGYRGQVIIPLPLARLYRG